MGDRAAADRSATRAKRRSRASSLVRLRSSQGLIERRSSRPGRGGAWAVRLAVEGSRPSGASRTQPAACWSPPRRSPPSGWSRRSSGIAPSRATAPSSATDRNGRSARAELVDEPAAIRRPDEHSQSGLRREPWRSRVRGWWRRSGRETPTGLVAHRDITLETDQGPSPGSSSVTVGPPRGCDDAGPAGDLAAGLHCEPLIATSQLNSVENVRPKQASGGGDRAPAGRRPSTGRRQMPRSARLPRSTRIS